MNQLSTITKQTMSSVEIAELTGKEHKNVLRDIRKILEETGEGGGLKFESSYLSEQNKQLPCFNLPYRETQLVISGYSVPHRLAIIDRWQELESKSSYAMPTHAEALRLYADSLDRIAEKDKYIVATNQAQISAGEILVREFVKANDTIGLGEKGFYSWMREQGIVMKSNEPYQKYRHLGYFNWKPTEEMYGGKYRYTLTITPRGKIWLAARYMSWLDKSVSE